MSKEKKEPRLRLEEIYPEQGFVEKQTSHYVIFSAQNNTAPNDDFLSAIKHIEAIGYQPICIPLVYQTVTPFSTQEDREVWWHESLSKYLINQPIHFNDFVSVFPTIRPSATTLNPLTGLINRSERSLIVGANRQHVESIASPRGVKPSFLISTGSVTVPNFRPGMAGAKAYPGHTIGALILEIDGDRFYWRHIGWRNDCFYDLGRKVTVNGIEEKNKIEAIIWGDFHAEDHSQNVWDTTIKITKQLHPNYHILHDLVTFKNGHHLNFIDRLKNNNRETSEGFKKAGKYLSELQNSDRNSQIIVVNSNHDHHLDGWLERFTHKEWGNDAIFYHTLMLRILRDESDRDPFYHAMNMFTPSATFNKIEWLGVGESKIICGHEVGNHGHAGPNGARGSVASLSKTTRRQIIGHSHIIKRNDTVTQTGTSGPLDESFHASYSATVHAHVILYPNETNTHIIISGNGNWRLD